MYVVCTLCKTAKPREDFCKDSRHANGLQSHCKACSNARIASYRKTGSGLEKKRQHNSRFRTTKKGRALAKRYRQSVLGKAAQTRWSKSELGKQSYQKYYTSDKGRATRRVRERDKWANDQRYRFEKLIRHRIRQALKGRRPSSGVFVLLGCDIETAMRHISRRFETGMSWKNHGAWHIDHIKPLKLFDLSDEKQQTAAFHFTNLQPLWARDNLRKCANYQEGGHC